MHHLPTFFKAAISNNIISTYNQYELLYPYYNLQYKHQGSRYDHQYLNGKKIPH